MMSFLGPASQSSQETPQCLPALGN